MGEVGSTFVSVVPSAAGFGRKLSGQIGPDLDRAGSDGGSRFGAAMHSKAGGIGKGFATILGVGLLGGLAAVGGLASAVFKTGWDESKDASAGTAQLTAGIKSTGNAAGVSVKGLNDLASTIQRYSGQTDDSIVASEKLLLTFTNIKNSKTDDIFDQATIASANMAAKMGGDASQSAIQLGKALNDPIKGVGALSEVGVSFTDAQKKSIKAMQEHGDMAGAQGIILAELNTEFGGAAKAAGDSLPGQLAKGKRAFEDLSQSVVSGLLPAFTVGLTGINDFVSDTQASFEKGGMSQVVKDIGAKIGAALPGIKAKLAEWGTAFWKWAQDAIPPLLVKLGDLQVKLGAWMTGTGLPWLGTHLAQWAETFVKWIGPLIPPMLAKMGTYLAALGSWMWNVALPAIGAQLAAWGREFWAWIGPMLPPFFTKLGDLLKQFGAWIINTGLPTLVTKLKEWATAFVKWIGPMIPPFLLELGKLLLSLGVWWYGTAMPNILGKLGEWGKAFVGWVLPMIPKLLLELGKLVVRLGVWWATTALPAILGWFVGLGPKIAAKASGMWDGIKDSFRGVVNSIIRMWNDLSFTIGGGEVFGKTFPSVTMDTPNIPMMAAGGIVTRPTLVMAGEAGPEAVVPLNRWRGGGGDDALLAEVQGLRADIRALPKTYQMGQRQYA